MMRFLTSSLWQFMAQRDYVSRKRKPRPPKKVKSDRFALFKVVLAFVAIIAFLVALWLLKQSKNDELDAEHSLPTDVSLSPERELEIDALPKMEEDEWEFIRSLPEYSVQIEGKEQEKSDKRYLMQCGSFRLNSQAEKMRANIAFEGFVAQVRPSEGSNGRWYRVILGPYESKRKAEKDRHRLSTAKIDRCEIWGWDL